MRVLDWLLKIKDFADQHRTAFDFSVGGSIGFIPSIIKYWEHFTMEESQFHFWDGIVNTAANAVVGAVVLWVLHRFILKKKK